MIVEADRRAVTSASDFRGKVQSALKGKPILVRVKRGDGWLYLAIEPR